MPLNDYLYPCNCENSEFCYPNHGHIISKDLSLIQNQKLRKPLTGGPNFSQWQSLNYSKCKKEIDYAIEEFAGSLRLKYKLEDIAMDLWATKILEKVKNKIRSLKNSK